MMVPLSPTAKTFVPELPQTPLKEFPWGNGFCHFHPPPAGGFGLLSLRIDGRYIRELPCTTESGKISNIKNKIRKDFFFNISPSKNPLFDKDFLLAWG
jgi:hypothetical protein